MPRPTGWVCGGASTPPQPQRLHSALGPPKPNNSRRTWTPWSVFQDGSFPGGRLRRQAVVVDAGKSTDPDTALHAGRRPAPHQPHAPTPRAISQDQPATSTESQHAPPPPHLPQPNPRRPKKKKYRPASTSPDSFFTPPKNASPHTASRTLSLSLQSAFHLSFTVLVRYRSRAHI